MKLYGTITSPFVRRVRVVAAEAGVAVELLDTSTDAGQAALRRVTPIWKVPIADIDGRILFDSRAIIDWIAYTHGWGGLAAPRDHASHGNLLNAIDGALDATVAVFYLRRENVDVAAIPYCQKQIERATAVFDWLAAEQDAGRFGVEPRLAELSLCCSLDWMEFRNGYPVASLGGRFDRVRAMFAARPAFTAAAPK